MSNLSIGSPEIHISIYDIDGNDFVNGRMVDGCFSEGRDRVSQDTVNKVWKEWEDEGLIYHDETHILYISRNNQYAVLAITKMDSEDTPVVVGPISRTRGLLWRDVDASYRVIPLIHLCFGREGILVSDDTLTSAGVTPVALGYPYETVSLEHQNYYHISAEDIANSVT